MTKLYLKSGKPSAAARSLSGRILEELEADPTAPAVRLYLVTYGGRGRFIRINRGAYTSACALLDESGIAYTEGNSAPRGGAPGRFIEIRRDGAAAFVKMVRAAAVDRRFRN